MSCHQPHLFFMFLKRGFRLCREFGELRIFQVGDQDENISAAGRGSRREIMAPGEEGPAAETPDDDSLLFQIIQSQLCHFLADLQSFRQFPLGCQAVAGIEFLFLYIG